MKLSASYFMVRITEIIRQDGRTYEIRPTSR